MRESSLYQWLADGVLVLHFAVIVFVVGGLGVIVIGNLARWRWVNDFWFRLSHGCAVSIILFQSLLGMVCPLTDLERWLRQQAQTTSYQGSFIEYWLQRLLFFEAPAWVFMLGYTLFGLLVMVVWLCFPPRRHRRRK